jgi:hypothetical protein
LICHLLILDDLACVTKDRAEPAYFLNSSSGTRICSYTASHLASMRWAWSSTASPSSWHPASRRCRDLGPEICVLDYLFSPLHRYSHDVLRER